MSSFKNFLKKLKGNSKKQEKELSFENKRVITLWTAGINYDSRDVNVKRCRLSEQVLLIRELDNPVDQNAIHVKRKNGESLGYIGKGRAQQIAPLIDSNQIDPIAQIIALKCDISQPIYGVKIAIPLPLEPSQNFKSNDVDINILFEQSEHGNLYLLLDCQERILDQVINVLKTNGVTIERTGTSYRPARDNKLYSWYLRLDNDSNQEKIKKLLSDKYPVLNVKRDYQMTEELFDIQDEEIGELKNENIKLKTAVDVLEKNLQRYTKLHSNNSDQFISLINLTLPQVIFLKDSMDVLQNEIQDYSFPIKKIREILNDSAFFGTKTQSLRKWSHIHFSTGQSDDGRLYFKRGKNNSQLEVLISFKRYQKRDIQFLAKNYN